jgi:predicted RNA-binding protein (virulence factor B family)
MIEIGKYHKLTIAREAPPGLYLTDTDGNEILLPNKYKPENFEIGDEIEVFLYLDHEERPVATTLKPFVKLDEFGYLRCVETTEIGAFLDWGLEKHLFVPFREQTQKMRAGEWYLVFCYLDLDTDRLVASSKVDAFLDNSELTVEAYEKVDIIVANQTDLGFNAIVNGLHKGLIYQDEIFQKLQTGDKLEAYVKKTRPDGKIDLTLQRPGYRSIEPNAQRILTALELNEGFLPLHDKSTPEEIQDKLQMSKKAFKKAVGVLYKKRLVKLEGKGVRMK